MDHSSAVQHHHQELSSQTLESMLVSTKQPQQQDQKKPRPDPEQALKCPRCDSANTKFCYYNNYSLSQPRYFCKSCRRYWTKGGTLRNVPVGGGCRKNKRPSSSSKGITTSSQDHHSINITSPNHNNNPLMCSLTPMSYDSSDLSLAFARLQKQSSGHLGIDQNHSISSGVYENHHFLDALRGGGFLDNGTTPNGFHQNLYSYGVGNIGDNMGNVENGGMGLNVSEEMGMHGYDQELSSGVTTTTTATTIKQEMCSMAREGDNNKVLWGFPWQINGGDGNNNNNLGDFDSSRRIWNGVGASWHGGLLNSPLM